MTILYCGDTKLDGAAAYLCGLLSRWGWKFDYVPSDTPLTAERVGERPALFIFSDYPAEMADRAVQELVAEKVRQGTGLLMIGGWESFCGSGGNWYGTPIGDILPVTISSHDDRINFDQPTLLRAVSEGKTLHSILQGLPWQDRPPTIEGLNQFTPKPGAETLLAGLSFGAKITAMNPWIQAAEGFVQNWLLPPKIKDTLASISPFGNPAQGDVSFELKAVYPVLVTGSSGQGRTAAFAGDVAPHWVGGFIDWGEARVKGQARARRRSKSVPPIRSSGNNSSPGPAASASDVTVRSAGFPDAKVPTRKAAAIRRCGRLLPHDSDRRSR